MKNYTWREITERKSAFEDRHQHGKPHLKTDARIKKMNLKTDTSIKYCIWRQILALKTAFEDTSARKLNLKRDRSTRNCVWRQIKPRKTEFEDIKPRKSAFEDIKPRKTEFEERYQQKILIFAKLQVEIYRGFSLW